LSCGDALAAELSVAAGALVLIKAKLLPRMTMRKGQSFHKHEARIVPGVRSVSPNYVQHEQKCTWKNAAMFLVFLKKLLCEGYRGESTKSCF
jgi:hypothetical protein